jgi:hypothetical protein
VPGHADRHKGNEELQQQRIGCGHDAAIDGHLTEYALRQHRQAQQRPEADDAGFHPVQHQDLEHVPAPNQYAIDLKQVAGEREQVAENQRGRPSRPCGGGCRDDHGSCFSSSRGASIGMRLLCVSPDPARTFELS